MATELFCNRIKHTTDINVLEGELDSFEKNLSSDYLGNSDEIYRKMKVIKERIEELTQKKSNI